MEAGLAHRDGVQRSVELTVAAPVKAHPLDLPRARRDRRNAGEGREGVGRAEAADVTDLGDEPRDGDRSRPRQSEEGMTVYEGSNPRRQSVDLALEAGEAGEECMSELRLDRMVPAQESPNRDPVACRDEVRHLATIARYEREQMGVQSIAHAGRLGH